ncbi:hypothetical protein H4R22_001971 [Coemansia sp. RSA 1290]|nr:hypothetical protein H4R22_001971 [Coemansia sp. RSA 1290]
MDIEVVRSILKNLDQDAYHQAAKLRNVNDDVWPPQLEDAFIEGTYSPPNFISNKFWQLTALCVAVYVFATVGQKKYQMEERYSGGTSVELIGRNDIISRYIFMKTGQYRARKQVSSHIQVWAHCKKPPSSRDMPPAEFEKFKDMFRQHYSRASTDSGQCRRRIRRVASTGNVTLIKKAVSRNALGIHSDPPHGASDRKRNSPWLPDNSAKRYRRVISELPSLVSSSEHSDSISELSATLDSSTQCLWPAAFESDAPTTLNFLPPQPLLPLAPTSLPQSAEFPVYPAAPVPQFDPAATSCMHSAYDFGSTTPIDPSVAAFTAATFSAMAGLDSGCVTPALGSSVDYMADSAALFSLPTKDSCAATDAISAFASAVGVAGPEYLPQHPELPVVTSAELYMSPSALHPWCQPAAVGSDMANSNQLATNLDAVLTTDIASPNAVSESKALTATAKQATVDNLKNAHNTVNASLTSSNSVDSWLEIINSTTEALKSAPEDGISGPSFDWHSALSQYLQSIG